MLLPFRLLRFWYINSLLVFFRTWQHLLSFLEEDLAVGLMLKLLFAPLFHDSSFVGKVLSFLFRSVRITVGLFAYTCATALMIILVLSWLLAPIAIFFPISWVSLAGKLITLFGLGLFFDQVLMYPAKKVWNIHSPKDIWKVTKVKKSQLTWSHFAKSFEVKQLLISLELTNHDFVGISTVVNDQLLTTVFSLAKKANARFITDSYFFVGLLLQTPHIAEELLKFNLTPKDLEEALVYAELKRNRWRMIWLWDADFAIAHLRGVNRGWLGAPTPVLDSVGVDLTIKAARFGFENFLGREAIVSEVIETLSQLQDRNVCLVGLAGVGKSTLVAHLAQRIIAGDAPESLATKRLVEIDLTKLISGAQTQGDVAAKVQVAFDDARYSGNVILYIDEIQNYALGDAGANFNLFSLLLPQLESGDLQFVASTEPDSFTKIIEKNASFARVFKRIDLPPATDAETLSILQDRSMAILRKQRIQFSLIALRDIVHFTSKLMHDRVEPDGALSIFNETVRLNKNGVVSSREVKEVISKRVNVPVVEINDQAKDKLLNLETQIHLQFINQQEAVSDIANVLRRSATGLRDSNRPIGSFLFVGPTGVGKTELAKILSELYFNSNEAFLRFDMSEYQTQESVNRLIGDSGNPGLLTEAVRHKPYALLLLDEFEKADPKLLTLFLQVLDDGRLTDSSGRLIDFSSTIIIATSNAAALQVAEGLQKGHTIDQLKPLVKDELLKVFKPELVNRFDEVVIFKPLSQIDLEKIVNIKLESLKKQMKLQGYLIEFVPSILPDLAQKGFDPVLGARPLRRLIQDNLEAKLSKLILEGKVQKGMMFKVTKDLLDQ